MKIAVIIDCTIAAVLLGFVIYGAWRGLFRAVAGLLIAVLSLTGAMFAARELTPAATELIRPVIQSAVTQRVDDALRGDSSENAEAGEPQEAPRESAAPDGGPSRLQADQLLRLMGWDEGAAQALAEKAEDRVRQTGVSLAMAVVDSVMESFVYMVLLVVSFLVLSLLLHLAAKALDLAARLPGVSFLNGLGGALAGLVQGGLVIFLAVWLLRCLNAAPGAELVEQTHVLRFFMTSSPLDLLFY